jgi:hypothetical protein
MVNLGYLKDGDNSHFVLITKLNCVVSEKYYSQEKLISGKCYSIFSDREALLNHEKKEHSDDSEEIKINLIFQIQTNLILTLMLQMNMI